MPDTDNLFYRKAKRRLNPGALFKKLLGNRRLLILVVVAISLLTYVVFGNRGILQRIRLKNERAELVKKIRAAEEEGKALQAESKALDGDKKAIEKAAREKHNLVRDGERIYKVNPEK
jgi:cell division protein FtsB